MRYFSTFIKVPRVNGTCLRATLFASLGNLSTAHGLAVIAVTAVQPDCMSLRHPNLLCNADRLVLCSYFDLPEQGSPDYAKTATVLSILNGVNIAGVRPHHSLHRQSSANNTANHVSRWFHHATSAHVLQTNPPASGRFSLAVPYSWSAQRSALVQSPSPCCISVASSLESVQVRQ